jgi:hypothetical protein
MLLDDVARLDSIAKFVVSNNETSSLFDQSEPICMDLDEKHEIRGHLSVL